MFRKSLILLVLVGACKMKEQAKPAAPDSFKALRIAETGGFTGGLAPVTFKVDGLVYDSRQEQTDSLSSEQLAVLMKEAQRVAEFSGYRGGTGNLQREIWLMRSADTLYYRWPIEDTTKTAKTLNVSFGRLYRLLP